jgi:UTP--glucose-1-phosphate uridylyltransferase
MKKSTQMKTVIRKAVIPAAGLGSRLGALNSITPKELLPLVNKPSLHWILDEAEAAGIEEVCLIISPSKNDLMQKFLAEYSTTMKIDVIMQRRAGGLGHAILATERWVGNMPFAVILPDDFLLGENGLSKVIDAYKQTGLTTLALAQTPQMELSLYGVADTKVREDDLLHVIGIIEKPALGSAPSNLSVVGRYVLTNDIWEVLHQEALSATGEIQLTSAIQALALEARVAAVETSGERHDTGNQEGWLKANIAFADWIRDGSLAIRDKNSEIFSDSLATQRFEEFEQDASNLLFKQVFGGNKLVEEYLAIDEECQNKIPQISTKMWDKAFMDLVQIDQIVGIKTVSTLEPLRMQWNRFKENPAASSPYVILFEDNNGIRIIDGHQRVLEMKAIGMQEIPVWIVRPLNFEFPMARL